MPTQEAIDIDAHPTYALGDTHLTYKQISAETGYAVTSVRTHASYGPLADVDRIYVLSGKQGPALVALEYDATLHRYLQTHSAPISTEEVVEMAQRMPFDRVAKKTGLSVMAIRARLRRADAEHPVWGCRLRTERAYARQMHAKRLAEQGHDTHDIALALGRATGTIRHYLQGKIDKPTPIEGRTPIWEQEHDLW